VLHEQRVDEVGLTVDRLALGGQGLPTAVVVLGAQVDLPVLHGR
jgi:hypothetical protein